MSTISNKTVTQTVTLGSVNSYPIYANPLTIASTGAVLYAAGTGVYASGSYLNAALVNAGTIDANFGVVFRNGGSINNTGLIQGYLGAINIYAAAGTVTNAGSIISSNRGVYLGGGGRVDNSGLIQAFQGVFLAGGTVSNSGTIVSTGAYNGVDIIGAGSVDNTAGLIQGVNGVSVISGAGTVSNAGTIIGTGTGTLNAGVVLAAGGRVDNTGGLIQGRIGVNVAGGAGVVTNTGTIVGTAGVGVRLAAGGTLVDSGTITGSGGTAVSFGGTAASRLVILPGYAIGGSVIGSGSASNTIELGSAASAGTLSGLQGTAGLTSFGTVSVTNFSNVTVAVGAQWTITGNNLIGSSSAGVTLVDYGTLTTTGTFNNQGLFIVDGGTLINLDQFYGGKQTLANGGYLRNDGLINTGYFDVYGTSGANVVVNTGYMTGFAGGVRFFDGGTINNSGTMVSYNRPVDISGAAGTLINSGTMTTTGGIGDAVVVLRSGGSVDNSALIKGYQHSALLIYGAAGAVTNSGTIAAAADRAVTLGAGGSVDNTAGLITGAGGVDINGGLGTVTNTGTIVGTGSGTADRAIRLDAGGAIYNTGGLITGGVRILGTVGLVNNSGTIGSLGSSRNIYLQAGGTVINSGMLLSGTSTFTVVMNGAEQLTNTASGYIGNGGIYFRAAGTLVNAGTITDVNGPGIRLAGGGTIVNTGLIRGGSSGFSALGILAEGAVALVTNSGTIVGTSNTGVGIGHEGIRLEAGGTVVNSGTILGTTPTFHTTIYFGGTGGNVLALQAGYYIQGYVTATGTANTLQLLGSAGAPLNVYYNGLHLTGFQNVVFGSGNHNYLGISDTSGTLGVTFSGFDANTESIDLFLIGNNGTISNFDTATDRVTVTGSAGSVTLQFDSIDGMNFTTAPDGGGGTDLTPVCYCRGTRILTPAGNVPVEDLKIGDMLVTLSGAARPIKWIGRRAYDGRFIAGNRAVLPVRIINGALADGVPARDLCVSPGHALYLDGVLVRAEHLINGATIVQESTVDRVEYFHVELEAHDILIAEGAAAESYVDCDNRGKFHNAAEFARLYPDDERPRWRYCAPLLDWGSEEASAIRAALLARAEEQGHRLDRDPDLHLVVDGAAIRPAAVEDRLYRFLIPAGTNSVSLASRSVAPAEVDAHARDVRRLGVPIERLVLYDDDLRIEAEHGHKGLTGGFHDDEPTHRWTDGMARLPAALMRPFPTAFSLDIHLVPSGLPYRLPPPARPRPSVLHGATSFGCRASRAPAHPRRAVAAAAAEDRSNARYSGPPRAGRGA